MFSSFFLDWFAIVAATNYLKLSGLIQHTFIILVSVHEESRYSLAELSV